ncbi:MAG: hypothetical protein RLZZ58_1565, partial [Pseudomonadota bacterium]
KVHDDWQQKQLASAAAGAAGAAAGAADAAAEAANTDTASDPIGDLMAETDAALAPPLPARCNAGPYIVFFDWDSARLTPEAKSVLDNAIDAYGSCGGANVRVAGYTDTSGTSSYAAGLSQRMASSVTNYLVTHGVDATRVNTTAFGESQLRVPTADGVREIQNRRVEITYGG